MPNCTDGTNTRSWRKCHSQMPPHLHDNLSPRQREVFHDLQKARPAFPSRHYGIPADKVNNPEVREWLLNYVRAIVDEAASCADVLMACYHPDDPSAQPGNLHKWGTKLTKRKEKPRLDSLKEWSFSRIIVIDILRTRKQDLVCSARHTFSGEWAILKIVWKRHFRPIKRQINRERKAWEALSDCQFIVGLKAFFSTSQCYVFVAEYYEGCTLQSLLEEGALRDDVIVNIVANVTYAVKYVHDRDMVYRNISPSTILIDMNGVARLFDFDSCSRGKTSSSRTGSIPYMAPEVLRMEVYDRTSDYWSLGILTYVLYVRHTPMSIYSAKTNLDCWVDRAYMYQYAEVVPIVLPKHMPSAAKSLISGLLVERPCLRLGCRSTGFYEVMKHPFFHKVDWDSFARKKYSTHQNFPKGYQSY